MAKTKFSANYDSGVITGKELEKTLRELATHLTKKLKVDRVTSGSIGLSKLDSKSYVLTLGLVIEK